MSRLIHVEQTGTRTLFMDVSDAVARRAGVHTRRDQRDYAGMVVETLGYEPSGSHEVYVEQKRGANLGFRAVVTLVRR